MPDSPHHETLRRLVQLHERDLADLEERASTLQKAIRRRAPEKGAKRPVAKAVSRADLAAIERAVEKHKHIIKIASDERTVKLLEAIADDIELAHEIAKNPREFAADHGIELPPTIVIRVSFAGQDVAARLSNFDEDLAFNVMWTRNGFQVPAE